MNEVQDTIITLDYGCVIGLGCKVHTHHKIADKQMQAIERFTIFGKHYCTNQLGQTFELPTDEPVYKQEPILMQKIYASDTISPTNNVFLLPQKLEAKIIIKPRTEFAEIKHTMDAPVMGMLLTFTIYLAAQWALCSIGAWSNLCSELKQCLRSTS